MMGGHGDRFSVFEIKFAFHDNIGIDDIPGQGSRIGDAKHPGHHDAKISWLVFQIDDLYALYFHSTWHVVFLRKQKDRADDPKTVFCFIRDDGAVLQVRAIRTFDIVFDIQGVEDQPSVFRDVELPVRRFAVFIR